MQILQFLNVHESQENTDTFLKIYNILVLIFCIICLTS